MKYVTISSRFTDKELFIFLHTTYLHKYNPVYRLYKLVVKPIYISIVFKMEDDADDEFLTYLKFKFLNGVSVDKTVDALDDEIMEEYMKRLSTDQFVVTYDQVLSATV